MAACDPPLNKVKIFYATLLIIANFHPLQLMSIVVVQPQALVPQVVPSLLRLLHPQIHPQLFVQD